MVLRVLDVLCGLAEVFFHSFNFVEGFFWIAIAVGAVLRSRKTSGKIRRSLRMAALLFLLFGVSDFVELSTGAWWRPWWLLTWKATCVVGLLYLWWCQRASKKEIKTPQAEK